jgi:hypothetical protein
VRGATVSLFMGNRSQLFNHDEIDVKRKNSQHYFYLYDIGPRLRERGCVPDVVVSLGD